MHFQCNNDEPIYEVNIPKGFTSKSKLPYISFLLKSSWQSLDLFQIFICFYANVDHETIWSRLCDLHKRIRQRSENIGNGTIYKFTILYCFPVLDAVSFHLELLIRIAKLFNKYDTFTSMSTCSSKQCRSWYLKSKHVTGKVNKNAYKCFY